MNKLIALLSLALASSLSAQITATVQAPPPPAPALQADPLLLTYLETGTMSFMSAGLTFNQVSNYALGDIVIGKGEFGEFFADVSFLRRESQDVNWFGVQDGFGTSIALYNPYNESSLLTSFRLESETYTTADLWHADQVAPYTGTFWQNDANSFITFEAIDIAANRAYTIFGIDDRRTSFVDFDDGAFLISRNIEPVSGNVPVPEPSTYGSLGAAALLGIAIYRRRKAA